MYSPDFTLAEELEWLHRQTVDIRRLCHRQRRELAEQVGRLQTMRQAITSVESSLEASRTELLKNRSRIGLPNYDL